MAAAVSSIINDNKGLREAASLCNNPVETLRMLRRHATGMVQDGCKPGPSTVLTEEEEEHLAAYLFQMADMGFGLGRDAVMEMAFTIVDKAQRKHPFLRMEKQVEPGLKALGDGIQSYHFVLHSHYHIVGPFVPIKKSSMTFLKRSELYMGN